MSGAGPASTPCSRPQHRMCLQCSSRWCHDSCHRPQRFFHSLLCSPAPSALRASVSAAMTGVACWAALWDSSSLCGTWTRDPAGRGHGPLHCPRLCAFLGGLALSLGLLVYRSLDFPSAYQQWPSCLVWWGWWALCQASLCCTPWAPCCPRIL